MWLINARTFQLEYFISPETEGIQYAILSHTWGRDEVSFQDFANLSTARQRQGFAKIERTCALALSEGYEYAWVDTCCIDKSSSAELSEAINTMFAWYQAASVCYAFLEDLYGEPFGILPDEFQKMGKGELALWKETVLSTQFAKCRWFTRGWTLQELIAPSHVVFYDAFWRRVGDKRSLRHILKLITRVDAKILVDNTAMLSKSVWRRMSWVTTRETTRTEDIAYCLLGIFDVNLPLIYGEGYKAFQRLQEEITRKEGDSTIFLWSSERMPPPQHRPPQYRNATTAPKYRGMFAWAPSEFLSRTQLAKLVVPDSQVSASNIIIPVIPELGPQSSVVMRNGTTYSDDGYGLNRSISLVIHTSKGTVYRPLKRASDGYILENAPMRQPEILSIIDPPLPSTLNQYQQPQGLRLLSQHMATLRETTRHKEILIGITSFRPNVSPEPTVWPTHRWEPHTQRWLYSDVELSDCAARQGPLVLGAISWHARLPGAIGDELKPGLTIICYVGVERVPHIAPQRSLQSLRFFGVCFIKDDSSDVISTIGRILDQSGLEKTISYVQKNIWVLDAHRSPRCRTLDFKGSAASRRSLRLSWEYDHFAKDNGDGGLQWELNVTTEVSHCAGDDESWRGTQLL